MRSRGDPELQGALRYLAVDRQGDVHVAGSMGGDDGSYVLTLKYDPEGNELWAQRLDSERSTALGGFVLDETGNAYVAAGVTVAGDRQLLVTKYGPAGEQVWVKNVAEPEGGHSAWGLAVDVEGQVLMTGVSTDEGGFNQDSYTLKLDASGNELWRRSYGVGYPHDVIFDAAGNAIVTGQWVPPGSTPGAWEVATRKYDPAGNELWLARFSVRDGIARKVLVDAEGSVYITGDSDAASRDVLTVRYDKDGRQLWSAGYVGPGGYDDLGQEIALGPAGDVYVAGRTGSLETKKDYLLIKYSARGIRTWLRAYDSGGAADDEAEGLAVDAFGNAYVTGRAGLGTATIKYAPDGHLLWVARYDGGEVEGRHWGAAIGVDSERHVVIAGQTGDFSKAEFLTVKYAQEPAFIRGDCNGDGKLIGQVSDAMAILRFFFLEANAPPCEAACDANGNGRTDDAIADAIYLLGFNFLGSAAPPPPFPECGYPSAELAAPGCGEWGLHCP